MQNNKLIDEIFAYETYTKGFDMLIKMGWSIGSGIGSEESEIAPVSANFKYNQGGFGLGFEVEGNHLESTLEICELTFSLLTDDDFSDCSGDYDSESEFETPEEEFLRLAENEL